MNASCDTTKLLAALACLLLAGCHGGHSHHSDGQEDSHNKPSPAVLPPTARHIGSGSGKFEFHVPQDGEIYVINASHSKDLLYSGPFVTGQVIQLDPADKCLRIDGRRIEEPDLKNTDRVEIYEDSN